MAIKNINANIITCLNLKHDNRRIPTYESIFDIIVAERINGKLYSPKMDIIVETTTIIEKEKEFDNFIQRDNNYKCAIAVTFEGDDFKILGEFDIDTKTSQLSSCGKKVWFCNKTCCAENQGFEIPETATYCDIVLLVYRPGIDDGKTWILQSVKRLYINKNI